MHLKHMLKIELMGHGNTPGWRVKSKQNSRANIRWCHLLGQETKEKKQVYREIQCVYFRYTGFEIFIGHLSGTNIHFYK